MFTAEVIRLSFIGAFSGLVLAGGAGFILVLLAIMLAKGFMFSGQMYSDDYAEACKFGLISAVCGALVGLVIGLVISMIKDDVSGFVVGSAVGLIMSTLGLSLGSLSKTVIRGRSSRRTYTIKITEHGD